MWKFDSCLYVIVFENLRIGKTRSGGMGHLRVQPRFLHSNATIHKWALGALAELLGNSLAEVRTGANYVNVDVLDNEKDTHSKMLPEVVSFIKKDGGERITGARIRDNLSGTEFDTYAKVVVNAGGPFCDSVENLADKDAKLVICPSSGVHIVLPDYYSPEGMGSIIPKTKDGRILFIDSEARLGKRTVRSECVIPTLFLQLEGVSQMVTVSEKPRHGVAGIEHLLVLMGQFSTDIEGTQERGCSTT